MENILNKNSYNIIAVDSENIISKSLEKMVRLPEYSLSNFLNLKEVSSNLKKEKFDIFIFDFSNITEETLKSLKKIRKDYPELYIILLIDINDPTVDLKVLKDLSVQGYCEKIDKLEQLPLFIEAATKSIEQMNMIKKMNTELLESKEQLVTAYLESIETLRYTVEAKDNYTRGHSDRVSEYSILIGKRLGLSQEDLKTLKIGGLFHDIGKIGISDSILLKNGRLTDVEYEEIKKHPRIGKEILSNAAIFQDIIPIVLYHHERFDGKGYPEKLADKDIPFLARIVCVADAFDAMTTKRSYRDELDIEFVKNEIREKSGTQFDPVVAATFLDILNNNYREILEIKHRF